MHQSEENSPGKLNEVLNHAFEKGGYEELGRAIDKEIAEYEAKHGELKPEQIKQVRTKLLRVFEVQEKANKILNGNEFKGKAFNVLRILYDEDIGYNGVWVSSDEQEEKWEIELLPFDEYISDSTSIRISGYTKRRLEEAANREMKPSVFIRKIIQNLLHIMISYDVPWKSVFSAASRELCRTFEFKNENLFSHEDVIEIAKINDSVTRIAKLNELYSERKAQYEERVRQYKEGEEI